MKRTAFLLVLVWVAFVAHIQAQHTLVVQVTDAATGEPLPGATVQLSALNRGAVADTAGIARLENLPPGEADLTISSPDYEPQNQAVLLPYSGIFAVTLHGLETEEIVITSTRSNRTLSSSPTRIEVLTEEIEEAAAMDPGRIAHLITHSTGLQVQTTSATSGAANVRLQGLDGRYTQILKDGFPLYGGFSGSLSILQIPPLDLRQVEYVKGSASTLYGGGAISGLINLVSRQPGQEPETSMMFNVSSAGALDFSAFHSRRVGRVGFSAYASRNTQAAFDPNNDGFADLAHVRKNNLNPAFYWYIDDSTTLTLAATFTDEVRTGGDMRLIDGQLPDTAHFYVERSDSRRATTQTSLVRRMGNGWEASLRNSLNFFERTIRRPAYVFGGQQVASFSEAAVRLSRTRHSLVAGLNVYTDQFAERQFGSVLSRNQNLLTGGAFIQHIWEPGRFLALESGLRTDYVLDYGLFVLPRVSALLRWAPSLTSRIGGGLGYRPPSVFNQEAELYAYQNVLAINPDSTQAERSYGLNADITWTTPIGANTSLRINQMVFFTRLEDPLLFRAAPEDPSFFEYANAASHVESWGFETWLKYTFWDFTLFVGYTYTNASVVDGARRQEFTLTPRHSVKGDLLWAIAGKWRVGVDYEYKSGQLLSDGRRTPSLFMTGLVAERFFRRFSIFINFENATDVRQSRYESLRVAPENTPRLLEVWAPLDGFIFNGGFRVRL